MKLPVRLHVVEMGRCIGCYNCMFACSRTLYRVLSVGKSAIQVKTQGGIESNFMVITCRGCLDPQCAKACKVGALKPRKGGGVLLDKEKCTGCGECSVACLIGAINMDPETKKPIVCIHCGACTRFCPHNVLSLEKVEVLV